MIQDQRIQYLIERYYNNIASNEETEELFALLRHGDKDGAILSLLEKISDHTGQQKEGYDPEYWDPMIQTILEQNKFQMAEKGAARSLFTWKKWVAAASILLIAGAAGYWLVLRHAVKAPDAGMLVQTTGGYDVRPGANGAILTLATGDKVVLNGADNKVLPQQGTSKLTDRDGQILYHQEGKTTEEMIYNTMSTPMGRQYQLVLADGSKVWLNAGSSIRYPVSFSGIERRVAITGEAYFEVAKNAGMPFKVQISDKAEVEVLGTHFNINAYTDEASINTTLLEGSVRIKAFDKMQLLAPGEQVQMQGQNIRLVKNADIQQAVAWKDGLFSFTDASLETVMRQLSRWYNVEVEYAGPVPARKFNGEIGRTLTLSQVLKGLTKAHVKYKIENGSKITILP